LGNKETIIVIKNLWIQSIEELEWIKPQSVYVVSTFDSIDCIVFVSK